MKGSGDARRAILRSIRDSLNASVPHDAAYAELHGESTPEIARSGISLPLAAFPAQAALEESPLGDMELSQAAEFCARLQAVGGQWARASRPAEARTIVRGILHESLTRTVALSDAPVVQEIMREVEVAEDLEILREPTQAQIFAADVGISSAQWAVAETGTLVLESKDERNRLISLIPPIHIALVEENRLCDTLEDVMVRLKKSETVLESRAITFITGPSRTADIEQMLVMGVHGPQKLYVVLIAEAEAAGGS